MPLKQQIKHSILEAIRKTNYVSPETFTDILKVFTKNLHKPFHINSDESDEQIIVVCCYTETVAHITIKEDHNGLFLCSDAEEIFICQNEETA